MPTLNAAPRTRRPRPWCIPPVSRRRPHEFVRGKEILTEIAGPVAVLLWLLHRDVELWAGSPPERRNKLFRMAGIEAFARVPLPEPLTQEVPILVDLLGGFTDAEAAAIACGNIAAWVRVRGPQTGLLFAEAAASLDRSSAPLALDVGNHAANCGLQAAAEAWFRHAIALGRRASDWTSAARAACELGRMAVSRDVLPEAARWYAQARRMVRRYRLARELRLEAARGQLRVALRRGAVDHAQHHLRDAERTYKPHSQYAAAARIALANDLISAGAHHVALALLDGPRLDSADDTQASALAALREHAAAGAERDDLMNGRRSGPGTHLSTPARL
jgi:hypothetical protein